MAEPKRLTRETDSLGATDGLGRVQNREERMPHPYPLELRRRQSCHKPNARASIATRTLRDIGTIIGVLACATDECVLEGLAIVDVFDAAINTDVECGGDALAKVLTSTVAMEVAPEGVTVVRSAMTPTTLGSIV